MKKHRPYTQQELEKIKRLRMQGVHPFDIAILVNRTPHTIDRVLSREKYTHCLDYPKLVRKNKKWTDEKIEQLSKEATQESYKRVGKRYNISAPRVYFLIAKGLSSVWKSQ